MKATLLVIIHLLAIHAYAQHTMDSIKITTEFKSASLEEVIEVLRTKHAVNITYNAEKLLVNSKTLSLKVNNISIINFLERICYHFNIQYQLLNNYVILKPKPVKQNLKPVATLTEENTTKKVEDSVTQSIQPSLLPPDPQIESNESSNEIEITIENREKTTIDSLKKSKPKEIKANSKSFALYSTIDKHDYNFSKLSDPNQGYSSPVTVGLGASFIYALPKVEFSIGCNLVNKNFTYHRNFQILFPDDPVSIPNTTQLKLSYIEIPAQIGVTVFRVKKVEILTTSGFVFSLIQSQQEETSYLTQGDPNTEYFKNDTNTHLVGTWLGAKTDFPILEKVSITIEPRVTKYFKPINHSTMSEGAIQYRIQAGIQLSI